MFQTVRRCTHVGTAEERKGPLCFFTLAGTRVSVWACRCRISHALFLFFLLFYFILAVFRLVRV